MHTLESVDVDPQVDSKRLPSVEEQMRWLHHRVATREFEDPPAFSDRPVYQGDDIVVDPARDARPGDFILCQTKKMPISHRLAVWPSDKTMQQVVHEHECIVGPVVMVGRSMFDDRPYLTPERRDFVLGTLKDIEVIRDKEDDDWQLESIMDLIGEVQGFECEVNTLLENLKDDDLEGFDPNWYVHLFTARVLLAALGRRTFIG